MKQVLDTPIGGVNRDRLFLASCMALVVTSMTFAIRAGMLKGLGEEFKLEPAQLGAIAGIAALGFPIATTLGGFFVDVVGMKRLMWAAFAAHVLGIVLTITAGGYWGLLISTFLIGFANGMVEAVCNPLVASMYTTNKTTMLNKFHVWFPGGIVIGSLVVMAADALQIGRNGQLAVMLLPTIAYAYLFFGQLFPKTERVESGISVDSMIKACLNPLFLFMMACMFLTANTELSTSGWVPTLLGKAGANPMIILALATGVMAVGRYFGGPIIHRLSPAGVLLASAIVVTLGIYLLRTQSGNMAYLAALVFGIGACYFWPTMLGFVSEYMPKTGALGLSLMGGAGMLGNWAYQTFYLGDAVGRYTEAAKATNADLKAAELAGGLRALEDINYMPMALIVAFAGLYVYMKNRK
ncbi:MAG: hypothetical protein RL757_807 [Bacteroidota bacterium]|jgi:MFS family permease